MEPLPLGEIFPYGSENGSNFLEPENQSQKVIKSHRFHQETVTFLVAGVGLEPTASGL